MTVQILYKKNDNLNNQVLFVEESYNINSIKKHISGADLSYIKKILKNKDLKKKILSLDLNSKKRLILVSVKKKLENSDIENLGADFYNYIKSVNINKLSIISNTLNFRSEKDFIGHFLHGLKLKSYEFNIYKTKKEKKTYMLIKVYAMASFEKTDPAHCRSGLGLLKRHIDLSWAKHIKTRKLGPTLTSPEHGTRKRVDCCVFPVFVYI